jgi:hypothetical protein
MPSGILQRLGIGRYFAAINGGHCSIYRCREL